MFFLPFDGRMMFFSCFFSYLASGIVLQVWRMIFVAFSFVLFFCGKHLGI